MAIGLTSDENYTAIADAIRAKTESEETYTPAEMPAAIMAIETGSDIEIDTTLTVSGAAADAKAVGNAFTDLPINIADDGYTDVYGLRQLTSIAMSKVDNTITITTTLQGDEVHTDVITLDENGYPTQIVSDGVTCAVSWEGFE